MSERVRERENKRASNSTAQQNTPQRRSVFTQERAADATNRPSKFTRYGQEAQCRSCTRYEADEIIEPCKKPTNQRSSVL